MGIDIILMVDCASNYGVFKVPGSKGVVHTVTMGGSEGPAFCDCKAYEFAPREEKTCKHIERVWKEACLYNPQWHDGRKEPTLVPIEYTYPAFSEEPCPACGGKTVYVKRAV